MGMYFARSKNQSPTEDPTVGWYELGNGAGGAGVVAPDRGAESGPMSRSSSCSPKGFRKPITKENRIPKSHLDLFGGTRNNVLPIYGGQRLFLAWCSLRFLSQGLGFMGLPVPFPVLCMEADLAVHICTSLTYHFSGLVYSE